MVLMTYSCKMMFLDVYDMVFGWVFSCWEQILELQRVG